MRSFPPDPSNPWPQDMAITIDNSSGKLMFLLFVLFLLFIREA